MHSAWQSDISIVLLPSLAMLLIHFNCIFKLGLVPVNNNPRLICKQYVAFTFPWLLYLKKKRRRNETTCCLASSIRKPSKARMICEAASFKSVHWESYWITLCANFALLACQKSKSMNFVMDSDKNLITCLGFKKVKDCWTKNTHLNRFIYPYFDFDFLSYWLKFHL